MKMCLNHPDRSVHAKGLCATCYNRQNLTVTPERHRKSLDQRREHYKKISATPEYRAAHKNRMLKYRYGITLEEFKKMEIDQDGKCFICGKDGGTTKNTSLYVDHCHRKNTARKLLCQRCNFALGIIEQGEDFVSSLYSYLELHK